MASWRQDARIHGCLMQAWPERDPVWCGLGSPDWDRLREPQGPVCSAGPTAPAIPSPFTFIPAHNPGSPAARELAGSPSGPGWREDWLPTDPGDSARPRLCSRLREASCASQLCRNADCTQATSCHLSPTLSSAPSSFLWAPASSGWHVPRAQPCRGVSDSTATVNVGGLRRAPQSEQCFGRPPAEVVSPLVTHGHPGT